MGIAWCRTDRTPRGSLHRIRALVAEPASPIEDLPVRDAPSAAPKRPAAAYRHYSRLTRGGSLCSRCLPRRRVAPKVEKFQVPEDERRRVTSGSLIVSPVTCRAREKISGMSSTLTFTDFAVRKGLGAKGGIVGDRNVLHRNSPREKRQPQYCRCVTLRFSAAIGRRLDLRPKLVHVDHERQDRPAPAAEAAITSSHDVDNLATHVRLPAAETDRGGSSRIPAGIPRLVSFVRRAEYIPSRCSAPGWGLSQAAGRLAQSVQKKSGPPPISRERA